MRYIFLILVLLISSAVNSFAEPELKGTPTELERYLVSIPKTVSLTGEKTLEIQAKRGIVSVSVKTEDTKLQKSLETNQNLRGEIVSKLIGDGIPQERIVGSKFSSTPEYGFWSKQPKSYKVENTLKVTVESEKEFQYVAKIVDSYKEAIYRGIEFKHDDKEVIKARLINLILDNLKSKQSIYETSLGIKLVPVKFVEHISSGEPPIIYQARRAVKSKDYQEASFAPLSFGETRFTGRITADYKVTR